MFVFCIPVECNLLMKTLTKVTSKDDPGMSFIEYMQTHTHRNQTDLFGRLPLRKGCIEVFS